MVSRGRWTIQKNDRTRNWIWDYSNWKTHKQYRKQNKFTDVLTFVSDFKKSSVIEKHCDIIISAETALIDAKKSKKNFYDHFAHLIIHSILHINGFSHNRKKNFLLMQNKEIKILHKLGISNPYLWVTIIPQNQAWEFG